MVNDKSKYEMWLFHTTICYLDKVQNEAIFYYLINEIKSNWDNLSWQAQFHHDIKTALGLQMQGHGGRRDLYQSKEAVKYQDMWIQILWLPLRQNSDEQNRKMFYNIISAYLEREAIEFKIYLRKSTAEFVDNAKLLIDDHMNTLAKIVEAI